MPPIGRSFQFNNNKIGICIEAEQIDSSAAVRPIPEFFSQDKKAFVYEVRLIPQQTLEVFPFLDPLRCEMGARHGVNFIIQQLEYWHIQSFARLLIA